MIEITFIEDYFAQGRVQISKGAHHEVFESDVIQTADGFINIYDIYDLEKRGIVTTKQLD